MSHSVESRLKALEAEYLSLQANTTLLATAVGVLLALVEQSSTEPLRSQVRDLYRKALKREVDEFLRHQADSNPALANAVRLRLAIVLDEPPT
jgi:hypothetical protein